MQKVLVIQTAFIGDVVLATGLIEKLHACFPDARIDFLVRKGNEALLANHPFLNEVLIWDKKKDKLKNLWRMLGCIRKKRYDTVINVQRFAATGVLTAFSGAKLTIGFDKNPLSWLFTKKIPHLVAGDPSGIHQTASGQIPALHEIERNHELIKGFTDPIPAKPRLYPSQQDFERVREYERQPYITVGPASVWFTKQYPADKWISFIDKVPSTYTIYLLGAPSDKGLCEGIISTTGHPAVVDLSGRLSFLQSAALMRKATMNYVNDSAPMHFASAVNAPVTAVYCSTVPAFGFGPLSDKRFAVEIKLPLDCRPCGLHGYNACPRGHFNCAYKIEDEQLLVTLQ